MLSREVIAGLVGFELRFHQELGGGKVRICTCMWIAHDGLTFYDHLAEMIADRLFPLQDTE